MSMKPIETIRGLLLDIDGTLLVNDEPVPGGAGLISSLREARIPFRVTTNTTRRPRAATAVVLQRAGFDITAEEILAPAILAGLRILRSGRTRAGLLVPPEVRADLSGIVEDESHPDWLVVGDIGKGFTWERLNAAFRWLLDGASLLALHKNRYWHAGAEEGLVLDAGAFVAALEYSAGVTAEVVGKPSVAFFELALAELGLPAPQVLVVGDDVETDIAGGAAAGCRTALVRTGRFTGDPGELSGRRPDLIVDSVSDLVLPLG